MDKFEHPFYQLLLTAEESLPTPKEQSLYEKINYWSIRQTKKVIGEMSREGVLNKDTSLRDIIEYAVDNYSIERAVLAIHAFDLASNLILHINAETNISELISSSIENIPGIEEAVAGITTARSKGTDNWICYIYSRGCLEASLDDKREIVFRVAEDLLQDLDVPYEKDGEFRG